MHIKEIGRKRPKVLPIKRKRKVYGKIRMDKDLSWGGWWKQEKTLAMPRGSGGQTAKRIVGTSEKCSQLTKMVGKL